MSEDGRTDVQTDHVSDAALIARSTTDATAFGVVFDRHVDRIYVYVVRRVGSSLAEELTAETFARAFERRAHFLPVHDSAGPWLFGIATNLIHGAARAERRRLAAYRRAAPIAVTDSDDFGDVEERLDSERTAAHLTSALAKLSSGDRDALLLYAWEELTYEQIAVALNVPVGTVASRINRARRQLRATSDEAGDFSIGVDRT